VLLRRSLSRVVPYRLHAAHSEFFYIGPRGCLPRVYSHNVKPSRGNITNMRSFTLQLHCLGLFFQFNVSPCSYPGPSLGRRHVARVSTWEGWKRTKTSLTHAMSRPSTPLWWCYALSNSNCQVRSVILWERKHVKKHLDLPETDVIKLLGQPQVPKDSADEEASPNEGL